MIAILMAAGVALASSLVGTRFLIVALRRRGIGQPIHEDVPDAHTGKAGTPTMGGIAIVAGAVIGYLVAHSRPGLPFTRSGLLLLALVVGAGAVGAVDDWIKVSQERNLGLSRVAKSIGLLAVAVSFAVVAVNHTPVHTTLSFTRFDNFDGLDLGPVLWCVWGVLLIVGSTNAVNLTDGLDGLAGGSALFGFAAFTFVAFWAFRNAGQEGVVANYQIPQAHALDLAVVAAALVGATTGFLWWNATPARIFMGDTGALAIGAALAGLALLLSTQLLLPLIAGLFVFETISVILQMASFRFFGRRVFRMAPIHHHYELAGWPETTIIVRFWILAGLSTAIAVGLFLADFIHLTDQ